MHLYKHKLQLLNFSFQLKTLVGKYKITNRKQKRTICRVLTMLTIKYILKINEDQLQQQNDKRLMDLKKKFIKSAKSIDP